jgi:hypothetical protein
MDRLMDLSVAIVSHVFAAMSAIISRVVLTHRKSRTSRGVETPRCWNGINVNQAFDGAANRCRAASPDNRARGHCGRALNRCDVSLLARWPRVRRRGSKPADVTRSRLPSPFVRRVLGRPFEGTHRWTSLQIAVFQLNCVNDICGVFCAEQ